MTSNPMEELREQAAKCVYCGGAKRIQIVSPVSDHAWADCFCVKAATLPASVAVPQAGEVEQLRHKFWMVICHASGGRLSKPEDVDRSINDICVQIKQKVNDAYHSGEKAALSSQQAFGDHAEIDAVIAGMIDQAPSFAATPTEAPTSAAPDDRLMGRWMPIETAPKDGFFDVWLNMPAIETGGVRRPNCFWHDGVLMEQCEYDEDNESAVYVSGLGYCEPVETRVCKVTHWMPHPAAPAALSTATGDEAQQGEG